MSEHKDERSMAERLKQWILQHNSFRRGLVLVRNTALVLLSLLFALFLLLQIDPIQNAVTDRLTVFFGSKLETRIELDYVSMRFFDKLVLHGFFVGGYHQDTLLDADKLVLDFNLNPFALMRRGLAVESVELSGIRFFMTRQAGDTVSNVQQVIQRLGGNAKKSPEKDPFRFDLKKIRLSDVYFRQRDIPAGKELIAEVPSGKLLFNGFDMQKSLSLETFLLESPSLRIYTYPELVPSDSLPAVQDKAIPEKPPLHFFVEDFRIRDAAFELHNYRKEPVRLGPADELNYRHLQIERFFIDVQCFAFSQDLDFEGELRRLSGYETSGFELLNLSAAKARVNSETVSLENFKLLTPQSELGDTLIFSYREYPDFTSFVDRVFLNGKINNAKVALQDIMVFAPGLKKNPFFKNNAAEVLQLSGEIGGRINNLRVSDLAIGFEEGTKLSGDFRSRDITNPDLAFFSLRLDRLNTNMRTLRQLIPNFNAPQNFNKLGNLSFNGSFDGFFGDFVAYGYLRTALGNAEMDMSLKTPGARENSTYSGKIALIGFDMGRWLDDPAFGGVNFTAAVKNGKGFTGQTVEATLNAEIKDLIYKGYSYENASLAGELNRNFFNGDFLIRDDNIDFSFNGKLDFRDSVSRYDFNAEIRKLDLLQLNLSKRDLTLAGFIDLNLLDSTRNFLEVTGQVNASNLLVIEDQTKYYQMESLKAGSRSEGNGSRIIWLESDLASGELKGEFDLLKLGQGLSDFLVRNHPGFAARIGLKHFPNAPPIDFSFAFQFKEAGNFQRLFLPELGTLDGARVRGSLNSSAETLDFFLDAALLSVGTVQMEDLAVSTQLRKAEGLLDIAVATTRIGEKTTIPAFTMLNAIYGDTLDFGLNYQSSGFSYLDNLNLNGKLFLLDSTLYQLNFAQSNLFILEKPWVIQADNSIVFGNNSLKINNFLLQHQDQEIRLQSYKSKGLRLHLRNLNFSVIDEVWDYDPLDFSGKFDLVASTENIFRPVNLEAQILSDSFFVNGDDWGALRLDVQGPNLKESLFSYLTITRGERQLIAESTYNLADLKAIDVGLLKDWEKRKWYDIDLRINHFPFSIAEYFLGNGISNTEGYFNAGLDVSGLPGNPKISGAIEVRDAALTVDFLKTRYFIDRGLISVDDRIFDASLSKIRDRLGNVATIYGGVTHEKLRNLKLDATLRTDRFLALDTKKGDNPNFYGQAIGKGEVRFKGPFDKPDIDVNAEVIAGSGLVIPITAAREVSELKFIRFVDKSRERNLRQTPQSGQRITAPTGVQLTMELAIDRAAQMQIVFDEQAGDIIQGQGIGNVRLILPRNGEFQMFGEYTIEQGNYLFTLYNLVNKKFAVRDGGRIQWSGDPYRAEINLEAEYSDLSIPVANLIQEYLVNVNQDIQNEASTPTDVRLLMKLQGELLKPVINFDLIFPQLSGQLQSYVENKLRILRQDQNELNKQVFGLIVIGQFFPDEFNFSGSSSDIIYNTLSEFVSNQLSLLLTAFFSEVIEDGAVLSGIDIDITYNPSQRARIEGQEVSVGDELEVRLKQDFFNDRLSVIVGGNIDLGGNVSRLRSGNTGSFVGNDLSIEYVLNEDRSLKLRIYQRLEPDIAGGRRLQIGTGLNYRKEFNSFSEFFASFKKDIAQSEPNQ
ncbi:MAG: translocation/assembly module TamB domain-containing protein [Saprospiraceae bacterium]|nr:translocation/assembly module TamB domain-containing protein [Saprospiraceae bacterium]